MVLPAVFDFIRFPVPLKCKTHPAGFSGGAGFGSF
jgi:hypothetical protein